MEKNKKLLIICFGIISILLSFAGSALLLLALMGDYTPSIGHFVSSSLLAPAAYCVLFTGPLLGIICWILFRGSSISDFDNNSPLYSFSTAFCAFLLLAAVGFDFYEKIFIVLPSYNILIYFAAAFGILAAAYLLLTAFGREDAKLTRVLSFFTPLYFVVRVLVLYFDKTVAINSPMKILSQLGLISLMLLFTADIGLSLGKKSIFSRYLFCCISALTLNGVVAISSLADQMLNTGGFEFSLADSCMLVAFMFLTAVKLFGVTNKTLLNK